MKHISVYSQLHRIDERNALYQFIRTLYDLTLHKNRLILMIPGMLRAILDLWITLKEQKWRNEYKPGEHDLLRLVHKLEPL